MGGGGLLQLVAYGAQDIYLTGNPQITFFKVVYRRHTNFAIESIQNTFNGAADFGRRVVCQIARNGDLIHRVYLQVDLPASGAASSTYVSYPGLRLLQDVEIEIGGQRIDKHYAAWMYIWNELSLPYGKRYGYQVMTGDTLGFNSAAATLYIPLEFWFCRNVGLALPLIALQYHEVKINIDFETLVNMTAAGTIPTTSTLANASLWVDYIFLDTDERRRYAQLSHEYLIEQLQFTGDETITGTNNNIRLNFNHPVKELVWVIQRDALQGTLTNTCSNDWTNFSGYNITLGTSEDSLEGTTNTGFSNVVSLAQLKLNGQDRFQERAGSYFNLVQPFQHHENVSKNVGINVYSFALKPEEHQPSGTLNMSRIDTAVLKLTTPLITSTNSAKAKIFAVNYNVLRIMSGMGGLAYSN
jgi:hypothetical protein